VATQVGTIDPFDFAQGRLSIASGGSGEWSEPGGRDMDGQAEG
jgi:hypothetical protein